MPPTFVPFERAARHPIVHEGPAADFFAGAVLGNGGLGAIVTTRPDAVAVHFGHNNVWDVRVAEKNRGRIGTFRQVFDKISSLPKTLKNLDDDDWYRAYGRLFEENASKPYPRPFPCGTLVLGFDRRRAELLGHRLDVAGGLCEVDFLVASRDGAAPTALTLQLFCETSGDGAGDTPAGTAGAVAGDRLWLRTVGAAGQPAPSPFNRVRLLPDPDTPGDLPPYTVIPSNANTLSFRQLLPAQEPEAYDPKAGHARDRAFKLSVRTSVALVPGPRTHSWTGGPWDWWPASERGETMGPLERRLVKEKEGTDDNDRIPLGAERSPTPGAERSDAPDSGAEESGASLRSAPGAGGDPHASGFVACVQLEEGLAAAVAPLESPVPEPSAGAFAAARAASDSVWRAYWDRSGVALDDDALERAWYHNLYFFNCATRPSAACPGLFGNWSYRGVGAAWHGGYHFNYNAQQPFWLAFSSNHVEKHLAYVSTVEGLLPAARKWAREYYALQGAAFPHAAYPPALVETTVPAYPLPNWGWQMCETPWAVQGAWWHYLYTMDRAFLETRAFPLLEQAAAFLASYMRRPEACGPEWGDGKYHVFPTVPPELYGLAPGFRKNVDCLADLALTRFVFRAYLRACRVLGHKKTDDSLSTVVEEVLGLFPEYPTADSPAHDSPAGDSPAADLPRGGKVFVAAPGDDPEVVQNTPVSLMSIFPGEEHGLHSPAAEYEIAAHTYRRQRNEGGNDLVFLNLQAARLGLLDLEKFKRQIRYCLLPNGACANKVLQTGGRYFDTLDFDFMARMGIWFENFALPAVINECLLQSYAGELRLFPNWPAGGRAEFRTLRAAGAFLVSAAIEDGVVRWVEITSEAGGPLRLVAPWPAAERDAPDRPAALPAPVGGIFHFDTRPGETLRLTPAPA